MQCQESLPQDLAPELSASLLELHGALPKYTGPFELPEPEEGPRALVERIVERESDNVPTRQV